MVWIVFALGVILGIIFAYLLVKSGEFDNPAEIIGVFIIGPILVLAVWGLLSFYATAFTKSFDTKCLSSYELEPLENGEYVRTVYTNDNNSNILTQSVWIKYDGVTRVFSLDEVTIHFDSGFEKYEIHTKKFKNKVIDFLFVYIFPNTHELFVAGDTISGDYTITADNYLE